MTRYPKGWRMIITNKHIKKYIDKCILDLKTDCIEYFNSCLIITMTTQQFIDKQIDELWSNGEDYVRDLIGSEQSGKELY
jgi:Fe-S cluster biogenesis protein NfuA